MTRFFIREMDRLKERLLELCAAVERVVTDAVRAVSERDEQLAGRIIEGDRKIDAVEVELEEECLKILALHQPVAVDLRYLVACLKITNDLERIGDIAGNIAARAINMARLEKVDFPDELKEMTRKALTMLRSSLKALVEQDAEIARQVCRSDEEMDVLYRRMFGLVRNMVQGNGVQADIYLTLLSVSRHLERIADLTTNIAEDVIYLIEGEIVRHRLER